MDKSVPTKETKNELKPQQCQGIPLKKLNTNDPYQTFYKAISQQVGGLALMKHGYRLFSVKPEQQDIVYFCLNLMQAETRFPLKFITYESEGEKGEFNRVQKMIWFETQFLIPSITSDLGEQDRMRETHEKQVYKFMTQILIPSLTDFKKKQMTWQQMVRDTYNDQKVIDQFQERVISFIDRKYGASFKK